MQKVPFEKYQALGNDFVLIDKYHYPEIPDPPTDIIKSICNRRYGVGADGILIFEVNSAGFPSDAPIEAQMTYLNSDGSRAETCFNGIRCMALHAVLFDIAERRNTIKVITDADVADLTVSKNTNIVTMKSKQTAKFEPSEIPIARDKRIIDSLIKFNNHELTATALSLGNPHLVAWDDSGNIEELNTKIIEIGQKVQESILFPAGTNFELASIVAENKILMAVWERGVGRTLACGSGATATVCAGVASGKLKPGRPIQVIMAGGALVISAPSPTDSEKEPITITGPAEHVYSGYLDEKIWSIY